MVTARISVQRGYPAARLTLISRASYLQSLSIKERKRNLRLDLFITWHNIGTGDGTLINFAAPFYRCEAFLNSGIAMIFSL